MRSFEEWLKDTEIKPTYEERTPMEIAYEAGRREGIGGGSKVPCSVGLCDDVIEGPMEDLSFLIEMSDTLKEGRHRNDSVRLDHVQQMIDDWIDQLRESA